MKLQFDAGLDYQVEAVQAVVDLFDGEDRKQSVFTVARSAGPQGELFAHESGKGNRLRLVNEELLENLHAVQRRHGLPASAALDKKALHFTVEMETGTGKTYVYLRTIHELHRAYGFTKFIVVVPSIAIKEGVFKSLQITQEHFAGLYDNPRCDFFVYDSQKLNHVRSFATSDALQVMVINIDAFRRSLDDAGEANGGDADGASVSKANVIHRPHDGMSGQRPIELIQNTAPVVIIDEPQSVDNTPKSAAALETLNPLCTLRYSATHRAPQAGAVHHPIYRLDAVDAYERKLVKQIEVASVTLEGAHNAAWLRLLSTTSKGGSITARLELDLQDKKGAIKRAAKTVRRGDDLLELSGGRALYEGYIVDDIGAEAGREYLTFTGKSDELTLQQSLGGDAERQRKRLQIRRTVEEHLDKELRLRSRGIKVLSLFFIDRVANYRTYDDQGQAQPGPYALWFEEAYAELVQKPRYRDLFRDLDRRASPQAVHGGYFATDKKTDAQGQARLKDSRGEGTASADEGAYALIMRDKERLLSFESDLKFIFSHSALREGWDNPNVFQICTLNESHSTLKKRQEIGRGLRIAVNQQGERVHGFEVNTLTVIANESYQKFADELQKELREDGGLRFGVVEAHTFANLPVVDDEGETDYLGHTASDEIWKHLKAQGLLDAKGEATDALRRALKAGHVPLPEAHAERAAQVEAVLRKIVGGLDIKNRDNRTPVKVNKEVLLSPEFVALWDRIKHRTRYEVDFDTDKLVTVCAAELRTQLVVTQPKYVVEKVQAEISRAGVAVSQLADGVQRHTYTEHIEHLPDLLTDLQDKTELTRRTLVRILRESGKLEQFARNPQQFIEKAAALIRKRMQAFIVDGIKYHRLGDTECYAQGLFDVGELTAWLDDHAVAATKAVHDHINCDSAVESAFVRQLESEAAVKVYAKLPRTFVVPTPLGNYNPDWAVLVSHEGEERLYFVVETKGTMSQTEMRVAESAKITCGRAHFEALDTGVVFRQAETFEELLG